MDSAYSTNIYPPSCIYNMDKIFFSIGLSRKSRKVAPRSIRSKAFAAPASNQNITVLACISVEQAAIPPVIFFQGADAQLSWTASMERHVSQLAEVTTSGRTSGYMMKKWLETIFDPYNRDDTPQLGLMSQM